MDELREAVIFDRAPEMMLYSVKQFEQTFRIAYKGLGWYYEKENTILLLPTHSDGMIRVWHWPKRGIGVHDPMNVYRWITGAPVQTDQR